MSSITRLIQNNNYFIEPVDRYIGWCITKNCTFNCPYCIYSCKNTNIFSSRYELDIMINYLNIISTSNSWVAIYGGEPTTHPEFLYVLHKYKYNVKIYTNLYKGISYLKELINNANHNLRILTSIHPNRTDVKLLIEKIYLLLDNNASVEVKCMFTGENDKSSYNSFLLLTKEFCNNKQFTILPRTIYFNNKWHTSEFFINARQLAGKDLLFKFKDKIFDKYDLQFNNSSINDYHWYKTLICDAGNKYISILDNFDIYPCCRYDSDFYNKKPLGNVITDPYFDFKRTICALPFCFPPEEDFILHRTILR